MLSPPSSRCSPTAIRSKASSPSSICARIRLKSVVPPPTSQTRISAPSAERVGQLPAMRGDPGVERGQRLLEQRQLRRAPRCCAACDRQLARLLVERRRHGQHDCCRRAATPRPCSRNARGSSASRRCASTRADASTGDSRGPPSAPHGRSAAVRSTRGLDSHDFADATCRAGTSAPSSRAKHADDRRRAWHPRAGGRCRRRAGPDR